MRAHRARRVLANNSVLHHQNVACPGVRRGGSSTQMLQSSARWFNRDSLALVCGSIFHVHPRCSSVCGRSLCHSAWVYGCRAIAT